jgi:hypothetical protein
MSSEPEKIQYLQAMHALEEFVKILVAEYPLVFKDGSGVVEISSSTKKQFFPYEDSINIKKISDKE